jgi:gamma-glutamylcyclotransferase (GGCT)/AIG2-like uncharacterized protein YtfP
MERLATYGTLRPGEQNHGQVSGLRGRWFSGSVRGRLLDVGWGAGYGFPGLVLDDTGDSIPVQVLESPDLQAHWDRLDEFEGDEYRRVRVTVATEGGPVDAFMYVVAPELAV